MINKYGMDRSKMAKNIARKLRNRSHSKLGLWFGLGMMGFVGWSVSVPILVGIVIGYWLDRYYAMDFVWTIIFMALGILLGCWNAWKWIQKESREVDEKRGERL